jgi:hypothetical protein
MQKGAQLPSQEQMRPHLPPVAPQLLPPRQQQPLLAALLQSAAA